MSRVGWPRPAPWSRRLGFTGINPGAQAKNWWSLVRRRWGARPRLLPLAVGSPKSGLAEAPWRSSLHSWAQEWSQSWRGLGAGPGCGQPRTRRRSCQLSAGERSRGALLWLATVVSLTSSMSQPLLNQPRYASGTIAPTDLSAPYDAVVIDHASTKDRQAEARAGIVPVMKVDPKVDLRLAADLDRLLARSQQSRQLATPWPLPVAQSLALPIQQALRSLREDRWQALTQVELASPNPWAHLAPAGDPATPATASPTMAAPATELEVLLALRRFHAQVGEAATAQLLQEMAPARDRYRLACDRLMSPEQAGVTLRDPCRVLDVGATTWQAIAAATPRALNRILVQGLAPGLPDTIIARAAALHLEPPVQPPISVEGQALAVDLLVAVLQTPNLVQDSEQTRLRAERAAESIDPVRVTRKAGEPIVLAGETITPEQFALLERYGLSRRETNWRAIAQLAAVVAGGTLVFRIIEQRLGGRLRGRDRLLLVVLSLTLPLSMSFANGLPTGLNSPANTLPAVGLLAGSFYGAGLGSTTVALLTAIVPMSLEVEWSGWLAAAAGGLLAAVVAGRLRSREELACLGLGVAIVQSSVCLILSLIGSAAAASVWTTLLVAAVLHGLAGLVWCVLALGVSPYLEHLFDLITPIRLAELSNLNRPLLQRLALEAPGTFQHVLFVSSLAEAAARALGCNVELVRAGTLYHDIGKLHAPQFFIENQMGGPNPHDALNDPRASTQIVKKHVSEGLVLARRAHLPLAIQAFIPEHQGTMLIAYFYYQAKQRENECLSLPIAPCATATTSVSADMATLSPEIAAQTCQLVCEGDFRYPGPIPQSRETAIVMLADSCEAALRSLENATAEDALVMVNRILRARWQDGQLAESGLDREELRVIAEVFVRVWQQCNHRRIAYPSAVLSR